MVVAARLKTPGRQPLAARFSDPTYLFNTRVCLKGISIKI